MTDLTALPQPDEQRAVPYRARALWQGAVVAATSRPVELVVQGGSVGLAFPVADVRWQELATSASAAAAGLHDLPGTAPHPRAGEWSPVERPDTVDGVGAVRRLDGLGLAVFDSERVRVELLAGDEHDPCVTAYPAWGDAADMVTLMDVQRESDGSWTGRPVGDNSARPVAEASQLLGQSLVAAVRETDGRRPVSAHMSFFRIADARLPLRFELTPLQQGRTFTAYDVKVLQEGKVRAAGGLLLGVPADDVAAHQEPAPPCPGPRESAPYDMSVVGRDLRVVDAAYTADPSAPVGPPVLDAWVRYHGLPDDPALHVGLMAQFTGHMSIAAALRPHEGVGQAQAHVTLSSGVNALHLVLHRPVRMDEWVRYHHHAPVTEGGMSHAENAVYDEAGRRLASWTAECMLRGFGDGAARDGRTAM